MIDLTKKQFNKKDIIPSLGEIKKKYGLTAIKLNNDSYEVLKRKFRKFEGEIMGLKIIREK